MTKRMGRVICDITISADGYSAGLNQTEERPFGDDGGDGSGEKLHAWMFDTPDENRAEVDQMTAAQEVAGLHAGKVAGTGQRGRSAPVLPDQAATRSVAEAADEALPRTMITAINLP